MKYCLKALLVHVELSPPTRGAWIEILVMTRGKAVAPVAPHTGGVD